MKRFSFIFILVACIIGAGSQLWAQPVPPDSKGKEFWFCFLPNFHQIDVRVESEWQVQQRDSLYIFVASDKPTGVTLQFRDIDGIQKTITRTITNPANVLIIGMPYFGFELKGYNNSGRPEPVGGQNGRVAKQSFHLTSDEEVTVYALNQAYTTSDAFLVLPADAIAKEYYVMSYNADVIGMNGDRDDRTPSQYAIVATEDGTLVKIDNAVQVFTGRVNETVSLNKGDVYLIQSLVNSDANDDLTGSQITADKPIAVFGGHQRARVPVGDRTNLSSRDCLIEQMPPRSTWGRNALLVPYPQPPNIAAEGEDRFRVVAAYTGTKVFIDSALVRVLDAGEYYEGSLTQAHLLSSNRPILVSQYKKTSSPSRSSGQGDRTRLGDPFMMIIPPAEQFMKNYRFINAQAFGRDPNDGDWGITYHQQFVTVVLPTTSIPSLMLDSKPVNTSLFKPIPKSVYSFAWLAVSDGVHTIEADTGVGIYVYGYGFANSYGYVGGMSFRRYDFNEPSINALVNCAQVQGMVFDTALADSRIYKVEIPPDSQKNVKVNIQPFTTHADSVQFSAALVDEDEDGWFVIHAEDSVEYVGRKRVDIPGFTIRGIASDSSIQRVPLVNSYRSATLTTYCRTYYFTNTGKFPQLIKNFALRQGRPELSIKAKTPATLKPGDTIAVEVCYRFDDNADVQDTLYIERDCKTRDALLLNILTRGDKTPPKINANRDVCQEGIKLFVNDSSEFDSGVRDVSVRDTVNCNVLIQRPQAAAVIDVQVRDWRLDAIYSLSVKDSIGNITNLPPDTIPGFTVMFSNVDSLDVRRRYKQVDIKDFVCDTVELYNYGMFAKQYDYIELGRNTIFSIPPHIFPFTLAPGARTMVPICYRPSDIPFGDTLWYDTLRLSFNCRIRPLKLEGEIVPRVVNGVSRCNVPVTAISQNAQQQSRLSAAFPNPASGELRVRVHVPAATTADVLLTDALGNELSVASAAFSAGGEYELQLSVAALSNGIYSCVLKTPLGNHTTQIVVLK